MRTICSTEEIQTIERLHIMKDDSIETALMERAGKKAAESILNWGREVKESGSVRYHVFCGPGNNGGDGFVIAKTLFDRGEKVSCWELKKTESRSPSSSLMRKLWQPLGDIRPLKNLTEQDFKEGDVVVDALFGIGLTRQLDDECSQIIDKIPANIPIIAIDILSGMDSSSGAFLASGELPNFEASLTLTFQMAKWGHYLQEGMKRSGTIKVIPIGLDDGLEKYLTSYPALVKLIDTTSPGFFALLDKKGSEHKYGYGHSLVLSGSRSKMGAAELAGIAALRVGSGLVTLGLHKDTFYNHTSEVKALMKAKIYNKENLCDVLSDERINALCLGPGLGIEENTRDLIKTALEAKRHVVLDADAISAFQDDPNSLFEQLHDKVVLTPHFGEFARLFPDLARKIRKENFTKIKAVQQASILCGANVLLKGQQTIIASPGGQTYLVNGSDFKNSSWLATAGSGDVLAGMITGLMARSITPIKSAVLAAYIHLQTSNLYGPGLIADDIPNMIPRVLQNHLK